MCSPASPELELLPYLHPRDLVLVSWERQFISCGSIINEIMALRGGQIFCLFCFVFAERRLLGVLWAAVTLSLWTA